MPAAVKQIRQGNQYSCVSASLCSALAALGKDIPQDQVDDILGPTPGSGASWEQALAALQYFGMRGTLVVPATIAMLRRWTDAGTPVLIGWTPRERPWAHASVVFDVDDTNVYVMDPNLPDPNQTTIAVPHADFYAKWFEKHSEKMFVRRPALACTLEVDAEGRQVMASQRKTAAIDLKVLRTRLPLTEASLLRLQAEETARQKKLKAFETQYEKVSEKLGRDSEEAKDIAWKWQRFRESGDLNQIEMAWRGVRNVFDSLKNILSRSDVIRLNKVIRSKEESGQVVVGYGQMIVQALGMLEILKDICDRENSKQAGFVPPYPGYAPDSWKVLSKDAQMLEWLLRNPQELPSQGPDKPQAIRAIGLLMQALRKSDPVAARRAVEALPGSYSTVVSKAVRSFISAPSARRVAAMYLRKKS